MVATSADRLGVSFEQAEGRAVAAAEAGLIRHDELTLVESAWQFPDTVFATFGWVIALKDGRRFYLEMDVTDFPGSPPMELQFSEVADPAITVVVLRLPDDGGYPGAG